MKPNANTKRSRSRSNTRIPQHKNTSNDSSEQRHDVKIRGNHHQVYEKYIGLAREASTSGDRVLAEHYYQHAEHYFRLMRDQQPHRPHVVVASSRPPESSPVVEVSSEGEAKNKPRGRRRKPDNRGSKEIGAPTTEVPDVSEVVIN